MAISSINRGNIMNEKSKTIVSQVVAEYNHLIKNLKKGKSASLICHIGGREFKLVGGMGKLAEDFFSIDCLDEKGNEQRLFANMHHVYFTITLFDDDKLPVQIGFAQ